MSEQQMQLLGDSLALALDEAGRLGATASEAAAWIDHGLNLTVRMGELETLEQTSDRDLAVTLYFGGRKGTANSNDLRPAAVIETVRKAAFIARQVSEDPCAGLAPPDRLARDWPDLDLYAPWDIEVGQATDIALACEQAARGLDPRITNSEGATLYSQRGAFIYGNSHGFLGGYPTTRHGLSCAVLAESADGELQRDSWYSTARHAGDLEAAETIGRRAAELALGRLGSRKLTTRRCPVIFRADCAVGLLRALTGALRGDAIYQQASFLIDRIGEPIFPDWVRIEENPLLPRGLASAPFDAEGVATCRRPLVQDGLLQSYLLDSYAARRLGLETTGNAGGVRNLSITQGDDDLPELCRRMGRGLVVTELMGEGANLVTGDYSRGACGLWVEDGEIAFPVEEITVAGTLQRIFLGLLAVGRDRYPPSSVRTGSWLIDEMTVAGD